MSVPDTHGITRTSHTHCHTAHLKEKHRVLFLTLVQENRKCHYGDKCKFLHDVAEYMASKPADVGPSCYLYDTFGACFYGVTCRFALAHTTADFQSMRDEARVKAQEGRTPVRNSLDKDLQIRLRKHHVAFDRSAEYLQTIAKAQEPGPKQQQQQQQEERNGEAQG